MTYSKDADIKLCLKCNLEVENICYFKIYKCNHIFCGECLCDYLTDLSSAKIKCPFERCNEFIPGSIIRMCISKEETEIYDQFCYPSNAVKCLSKNCNYFVAHQEMQGHFICPHCGQPNCVTCSNYHLQNEPCGISNIQNIYEKNASTTLIQKRRLDLLEISKEQYILRNPEKSYCELCENFILPREGRIISSCFHNFCKECLNEFVKTAERICRLKCLICDTPLHNVECRELLGDNKLETLNLKAVVFKFYHCNTPDCTSFWDPGTYTGFHKCEKCQKDNCIPCNDIHEGKSCEEYKQSERYKTRQKEEKFVQEQGAIYCFNCNNRIIRKGGCGALKCNNCDKQVCAFSGKELGPNGCQCRKDERCDPRCDQGCIPEGQSYYEVELYNYFFGPQDEEEEANIEEEDNYEY